MRRQIGILSAWLLAIAFSIPAWADEPPIQAQIDADGVQRVTILGGSYFFKPSHIIVKANVPVELTVSVEPGMASHNFVIKSDVAKIAVEEKLGTTPKKIVFTPAAAGKFPFYCSKKIPFFESHREQGMEGVLEVID